MSAWIPVSERLPPQHKEVAILISDPSVAIVNHPTVARLQVETLLDPPENRWWAGVPGNWHKLPGDGWAVTHWAELPELPAKPEVTE